MKRALVLAAALGSFALVGSAGARNALLSVLQTELFIAPFDQPTLRNELLAKAKPDECYDGIGNPYPPIAANGTCSRGRPKTNQAYVWGLVQVGEKLWFGTAPNVECLVVGGFLGSTQPSENQSWVCEFGSSQLVKQDPALPAAIGDWRPPHGYEYDIATKILTDRTPADVTFTRTLGLRSAGSQGDIVFLAGPALDVGVNFFAFKSSTGTYLGSCNVPGFTNIRQWINLNGALYAGFGTQSGGGVFRWQGTEQEPFVGGDSPCSFEIVANLPGDAAFLTAFGTDRIAVSAWPSAGNLFGQGAGVYLSPSLGSDGLNAVDASTAWTPLWTPGDYEPDLITQLTYGGGAIAEWRGDLYFGTMHVPGLSAAVHASPSCTSPMCYGQPQSQQQFLDLFVNTYRAIAIWRIKAPTSDQPQVQLLYGESELSALVPGTKTFVSTPTHQTPLLGASGFDNPYNNYTWTATTFQDRLFFGTMDWRYLLDVSGGAVIPGAPILPKILPGPLAAYVSGWGADLWRFDYPGSSAAPENVRGTGNFLNYGVRSMITAADGQSIYIGTANPMNLEPKGGWELRRLRRSSLFWLFP